MEPDVPSPALTPSGPAATIADVVARMHAIEAALPPSDGIACFNRMYLGVTLSVDAQLDVGAYDDPAWISALVVVFANRYLAAVDTLSSPADAQPPAWRPLIAARATPGIEPIQYALAGMNIHIANDLPLAVVATCTSLNSAPSSHRADYQRVDKLLDDSEQAVRESFEPADLRQADRHVAAVVNLVCNWSINEARDVAWDTALGLWEVRSNHIATRLLTSALARVVSTASRTLLVAV